MDEWLWLLVGFALAPALTAAWTNSAEEPNQALKEHNLASGYSRDERHQLRTSRRNPHYLTKRHMATAVREDPRESRERDKIREQSPPEQKRRSAPRSREVRKKPSGHLKPLHEDELDNDEVVSVAIGPPPMRPKYDKMVQKQAARLQQQPPPPPNLNYTLGATNMVKDILTLLGREFLTHQVSEDFVFGQYVGNSMKNLSAELKGKLQHEILDSIIRYQKLSRGDSKIEDRVTTILKDPKLERKPSVNASETEDSWPDFTNLATIVG